MSADAIRDARTSGLWYGSTGTSARKWIGFVRRAAAPRKASGLGDAELRDDLHARGLEYLNTELPTGTLFPDGEGLFLTTSHEENAAALGPGWEETVSRFLPNADLAFGVLSTELWSRAGLALALKA